MTYNCITRCYNKMLEQKKENGFDEDHTGKQDLQKEPDNVFLLFYSHCDS